MTGPLPDRLAPERVLALAPGETLAVFNRSGALSAADVHVALRLARLTGETDELVTLAAALAVRAPRFGHVLADLSVAPTSMAGLDEGADLVDVEGLPWPEPARWWEAVAASPLVAVGDEGAGPRPLRLVGPALYLARYWEEERAVAGALLARATADDLEVERPSLQEGLDRLFGGEVPGATGPYGEQAQAVSLAVRRRLAVVAGGPGTGKTTTIARLLALLGEQACAGGRPLPLVALAAPTGKAAARMAEAVHQQAAALPVSDAVRQQLLALQASTVHRLLGRHPASANRFRHDRHNRLPHDVVVVDETSMMSLSLMASLLQAVRPEARLVLLGDPQQLASVEAGAVLGDIVGPAVPAGEAAGPVAAPGPVDVLGLSGAAVPAIGRCIAVLSTNHRFSGPLAELARAVKAGDADAAVDVLRPGELRPGELGPGLWAGQADGGPYGLPVRWLPVGCEAGEALLEPLRHMVVSTGRQVIDAAGRGDAHAALVAAGRLRVLCAHRHGPAGASTWNARVEQWLAADGLIGELTGPPRAVAGEGAPFPQWYLGRPVIVTANDYSTGLFNGDLGVTVARSDGALSVVFPRGQGVAALSPSRLPTAETAYAMTAHRAQGSEFDDVAVVLPDARSPVLTRELLYTALTRARRSLLLLGLEETVRSAVERPVARASGLTARLWGAGLGPGAGG